MRVRFAPSPTGHFHIGSLRTALFNWLFAKKNKADFILRIEDTDTDRSERHYETPIYESLQWTGLTYDAGPYRQSERFDQYTQAVQHLLANKQAYRCFCSDADLAHERDEARNHNRPYRYSRRCRHLSDDAIQTNLAHNMSHTIRFAVPESGDIQFTDAIRGVITFDMGLLSDFILVKSSGVPSYHLAVVSDDIAMKITHVLRGEDHISNTPGHYLLFKALGETPPIFGHFPIILGSDRSKLSKRHGALSVLAYRDAGYLPEALLNYVALLGWSPPDNADCHDLKTIIQTFDLKKITKSGAIFDNQKLRWMNRNYINQLSDERYIERVTPFISQTVMQVLETQVHQPLIAIHSVRKTLDILSDINTALSVYTDSAETVLARCPVLSDDQVKIIQAVDTQLRHSDNQDEPIRSILNHVKQITQLPLGLIFKTMRYVVTGIHSGPDLITLLSAFSFDQLAARCQGYLSKHTYTE